MDVVSCFKKPTIRPLVLVSCYWSPPFPHPLTPLTSCCVHSKCASSGSVRQPKDNLGKSGDVKLLSRSQMSSVNQTLMTFH